MHKFKCENRRNDKENSAKGKNKTNSLGEITKKFYATLLSIRYFIHTQEYQIGNQTCKSNASKIATKTG